MITLFTRSSLVLVSNLISLYISCLQDEPYLFAEIEALNITDPLKKVYFINDELRFSWKVKHGNGSYENANNVTVSFHYPTPVVFVVGTGLGNVTRKNGITLPKGMNMDLLIVC